MTNDELRKIYEFKKNNPSILKSNNNDAIASGATLPGISDAGAFAFEPSDELLKSMAKSAENKKKSDSIISKLEGMVVSDQSLVVASAAEKIRKDIAAVTSQAELHDIYSKLNDGGSIKSFLNGQVAQVNLSNKELGVSLTIETVRNSRIEDGQLLESVLSRFDLSMDGLNATIFSETINTGQGKFEQLKIFGEQGDLMSSKVYQLGDGDLSIAEAGWSQFALGDTMLNMNADFAGAGGSSLSFGDAMSHSFGGMGDIGGKILDGRVFDDYSQIPGLDLSETPFVGQCVDNRTNTYTPHRLEPAERPGGRGSSGSSDMFDFGWSDAGVAGSYGVGFKKDHGGGYGHTLDFDFNPETKHLDVKFSGSFSGEACTPDIPQTPFPDKVCLSGELKGEATFAFDTDNMEYVDGSDKGNYVGSAKVFYRAGTNDVNGETGVEVSVSSLVGGCGVDSKAEVYGSLTVGPYKGKVNKEIANGSVNFGGTCDQTKDQQKADQDRERRAREEQERKAQEAKDEAEQNTNNSDDDDSTDDDEKKKKNNKPGETGCVAPGADGPNVLGGVFTGGGNELPNKGGSMSPPKPKNPCGTPTGIVPGSGSGGSNGVNGTDGGGGRPSCGTVPLINIKPERLSIGDDGVRPGCGSTGKSAQINNLSQAMSSFASEGSVGALVDFGFKQASAQQFNFAAISNRL
ncbi:hypothetical protein [Vibrio vulnificus]|uniref:hypothetical protein n=1 Tax=Vibrio vulnificus TaxID=672 RepID=UPI0010288953|nr:hypothetical protein [Vibrio vulnificus]EGQ9832340.1 hypothetical protein [Vibrio vulnificus]RZR32759.1 hypothetical protein D8T33_13760 [Vibrio vulnificus]